MYGAALRLNAGFVTAIEIDGTSSRAERSGVEGSHTMEVSYEILRRLVAPQDDTACQFRASYKKIPPLSGGSLMLL